MAEKSDPNSKLIAENRRARFDYAIESDIEAGIVLFGSEVKSLRQGGANIAESYANVEGWNATAREGMTIVPLEMYFNARGMVKLKLGVAKGKKLADKRETEAKRDWNREKARLMKQNSQG
jgi:SsrA-binding protein